MVKQFDWGWAIVTEHAKNNAKTIGVFSPDRSLAIYPTYFIFDCLKNNEQVKVLLSYNMLQTDGAIPKLPSNSYVNVMENVQFIIPP